MFTQMDAVCHRFEELSIRLNQPDTAADPALFRRLMREYHDAEPVVQAYRAWQTAQDHLAQAKALLEEPGALDPDFKQMIQQEISEKSQDVEKLENNLKILLLPKDVNDGKNVIMEIRGGARGEEAAPRDVRCHSGRATVKMLLSALLCYPYPVFMQTFPLFLVIDLFAGTHIAFYVYGVFACLWLLSFLKNCLTHLLPFMRRA